MAVRSYKRLILALLYLAVLFPTIAWFYSHLRAFEGIMLVAPGKSENIAVVAAKDDTRFVGIQRHMPVDILPLNSKAIISRYLDSNLLYSAVTLPYHVTLANITILEKRPPRDYLEVTGTADTRELEWVPNGQLHFAGKTWQMKSIQPWTGLVRHASGVPVAIVSLLNGDDAIQDVAVYDEKWTITNRHIGIRLVLATDENQATQHFQALVDQIPLARWGVRDRGRVQWLSSVTPGAGMELSDGRVVTLLAVDASHVWPTGEESPGISVEVQRGKNREKSWIAANAYGGTSPIVYESVSALQASLYLVVWRDGRVLALALEDGRVLGKQMLDEAEEWQIPTLDVRLRLDQVMLQALVARNETDAVSQAVLKSVDEVLRLREGTAMRAGSASIRFRRAPVPPDVQYTLSFSSDGDGTPEERTITGDELVTYRGWRFSILPHVGGGEVAVLKAERAYDPLALAGLLLVALASTGLVIVRFRPIR